jgi:hypothetical protein
MPVVLLSVAPREEEAARAAISEASGFIKKPVDLNQHKASWLLFKINQIKSFFS